MKQETFSNAVSGSIALVFAIVAIILSIATLTWWNGMFGMMAGAFAWFYFTTDENGESVKHYIQRKRGK